MKDLRFIGHEDNARLLWSKINPFAPRNARLLDLGCGTGDIAFLAAQERPDLDVTGVDYAPLNIQAAQSRAEGSTPPHFMCADYLSLETQPFDVVVADSVLQLIEAPIEDLAAKLARDLRAGGILIATVPDDCLRNRLLLLFRRIWRFMPLGVDLWAARVGHMFHPSYDKQAIYERMAYMRILPRLFGEKELAVMSAAGFALESRSLWFDPSLAKPRHALIVWRRVS